MKNPLERGMLMDRKIDDEPKGSGGSVIKRTRKGGESAATQGSVVKRAGKPKDPQAAEKPAKRGPEKDEQIPSREKQMDIMRWWIANRTIPWKQDDTGGRITIDQEERKYHTNKKVGFSLKKKEGPRQLEFAILEVFSADGALNGRYDVADGSVFPYGSCDIDDTVNGADGLLIYTVEDNDREGALVGVDATTNRDEYLSKLKRGLRRTAEGDFAKAYWYDVGSKKPGEYLDNPKEGKVPLINTTIFIDEKIMDKFVSEETTAKEGDALLKRIGALAAQQQSWELEIHARILTKTIILGHHGDHMTENVKGMSRSQLLIELKRLMMNANSPLKAEAARILSIALPAAWENANNNPVQETKDATAKEILDTQFNIKQLLG
ncbi:MAG: hypothetical protein H6759_05025 [Candidatus Nomurabacteria bacterium]|nr:MAG: hypothetical protein H6759_05025 [Candidatus Nomurabacteria bacterium]